MAVERMFMAKYIGKRLLMMIPVIIGVVFIIYSIMELTPGDPVMMILGAVSYTHLTLPTKQGV